MTTQFDNLNETELAALCEKYGLKSTKKNPNQPYFQVIRGKAVRVATKLVANKNGVPQKNVKLLDTHKVSGSVTMWRFQVDLECKKVHYKVLVDVEPTSNRDAKLISIN